MMKYVLIFLIPCLAFSKVNIRKVVGSHKKDDLINDLREFVECCRPNRLVGTVGSKKAVPFLVDRIKEMTKGDTSTLIVQDFYPEINLAIKSYKDDFKNKIVSRYDKDSIEYQKWSNFTDKVTDFLKSIKKTEGRNLIWEKKGSENKTLIIGANIDTISMKKDFTIDPEAIMPGADDNASGVSILLGMIKALSKVSLKRNIKIIFFDFQELSQLGSKAYLDEFYPDLKKNIEVEGFVNLLMLGHDSKTKKRKGDFKAYVRANNSKDMALAENLIALGKRSTSSVRFEIASNELVHSDQIRFWEKGIPAVVFSQNWEEDYNKNRHHTENDFPETLNFNTLYKSYVYLTSAVMKWALDIDK